MEGMKVENFLPPPITNCSASIRLACFDLQPTTPYSKLTTCQAPGPSRRRPAFLHRPSGRVTCFPHKTTPHMETLDQYATACGVGSTPRGALASHTACIISLRRPCSTLRSRISSLSNVMNSATEGLTKFAKINASLPPSPYLSANFKPVLVVSLV